MPKHSPASVFEQRLPSDLIHVINSYLPIPSKKKKEVSPSLQHELKRLQSLTLKGKNEMYMRDFEDFILH